MDTVKKLEKVFNQPKKGLREDLHQYDIHVVASCFKHLLGNNLPLFPYDAYNELIGIAGSAFLRA